MVFHSFGYTILCISHALFCYSGCESKDCGPAIVTVIYQNAGDSRHSCIQIDKSSGMVGELGNSFGTPGFFGDPKKYPTNHQTKPIAGTSSRRLAKEASSPGRPSSCRWFPTISLGSKKNKFDQKSRCRL